jgi:hypothetical protein
MATWNPPADAVLLKGKPGKPSLARAIRDLPEALAERAAGAPWINAVGTRQVFHSGEQLSGLQSYFEYRAVGEWVVPDEVYRVSARLIGGGGAGGTGEGDGSKYWSGGGGGAGAVVDLILAVMPGQVFSLVIGLGGDSGFIHPDVDQSLDSFVQGDGSRTIFGNDYANGGRRGVDGDFGGVGGYGGADPTDPLYGGETPTVVGATGGDSLFNGDSFARGGKGAASILGDGAGGRPVTGNGPSTWNAYPFGLNGIPGAGGAGGRGARAAGTAYTGGRGSNGAIILDW